MSSTIKRTLAEARYLKRTELFSSLDQMSSSYHTSLLAALRLLPPRTPDHAIGKACSHLPPPAFTACSLSLMATTHSFRDSLERRIDLVELLCEKVHVVQDFKAKMRCNAIMLSYTCYTSPADTKASYRCEKPPYGKRQNASQIMTTTL